MAPQRWKNRPEGSNWGDFGSDDQLGRLNLLTPEKVKQGVAEVREGLTFCLSLPLDYPGGDSLSMVRRKPPILRPNLFKRESDGKAYSFFLNRMDQEPFCLPDCTEVVSDDLVIMHLQYSSQWDAFSHLGHRFDADDDGVAEAVFYNGYRGGEDIVASDDPRDAGATADLSSASTSCAHKLGIETLAEKCIQGRAVMVDLHAHYGREKAFVDYDDLMRIMERDKVVVERGDMVCLHTGTAQMLLDMKKSPDRAALFDSFSALDGRDERILQWITDSGLAALIADNKNVEAIYPPRPPSAKGPKSPIHTHCLFKLGIPLGEYWYLTELAQWLRAHGRSRFLLTGQPLRLPGAVGSPPAPVATV